MEDFANAASIWFAEGIFNAWALEQAGQRAASTMSSNNYPSEFLRQLRTHIAASDKPHRSPKIIFAFDVGPAGTKGNREFVKQARNDRWDASAALPMGEDEAGKELDWNDLLRLDRLGEGHRADYLWHGQVLLAQSAQEKAYLIWEKHRWNSFHFNFGNRTYWCSIDISVVQEKIDEYRRGRTRELKDIDSREEAIIRMEASREALGVEEIANCAFRVLYRQRDEATDETKFFLDIRYPSSKRAPVKGDFTAAQLRKSSNFEDRLFAFGGVWTGNVAQLTRILQHQTPICPTCARSASPAIAARPRPMSSGNWRSPMAACSGPTTTISSRSASRRSSWAPRNGCSTSSMTPTASTPAGWPICGPPMAPRGWCA
jgi:hypothetical protein